MKQMSFNKAMTFVVAVFSIVFIPSCVDADYELSEERLNTEVTLFQDGLTLPIGKTAPITLASLLEDLDEEARDFLSSKDGAYLFRMADTLDFSEQMAGLTDMINIDGITVNEQIPFNLSNVDLSDLEIKVGDIKSSEFDIAGKVDITEDIKLPVLSQKMDPVQIAVPKSSDFAFEVDFSKHDVNHTTSFANFKDGGRFSVSDEILNNDIADLEMPYEEIGKHVGKAVPSIDISESFDETTITVPIEISLPKEVKSVEDITLSKDAVVEVDVFMTNSLFTSGEIDPTIDIDLHNLFHLVHSESGVTADDHLNDHFVISGENKWFASHDYHVESLAISGKDFERQPDGTLLLKEEIPVTASGIVAAENLKTTIRHLHDHNDDDMLVTIDLKFKNFDIDNIKVDVEPIVESQTLDVPVTISGIELPEMVDKVEYVDLTNPLKLALTSVMPDAYKPLVKLDKLEIVFPENIVVEHDKYNDETHAVLYENLLLADGLLDDIKITRMYLPDPVNGTVSYDGTVKVTALASAGGIINTADLKSADSSSPVSDGMVTVDVNVEYNPELVDYNVLIGDYEHDVNIDPIRFSEPLPSDVGEVGKISVFLEKGADGNNPAVVINLDYPGSSPEDNEIYKDIKVLPKKGEGLKVKFAEEIVFESLPAAYNYNPEDNSISFTGDQQIPSEIRLPISRLDIVPEDNGDGGFKVSGEIEIIGGVRLAAMSVNKALIEQIKKDEAKVSFNADVPVLKPAQLNVGEYVALIDETIELGDINLGELPDMVKSVGDVTLKDVELNLVVDASEITKVVSDAEMTLEMDVKLPEFVVIDHKDVDKNNVLHVRRKLENSKFVINYEVARLDLSSLDLTADEVSLKDMNIEVDGQVVLENANVDLGSINDKELNVVIDGSLCSKGSEEILIDKINAVVDYQVDPVHQSVDLSALTGSLSGNMDLNIDLNRFNLALEVKTNLGVPVNADLEIIPYKDGAAMEDKILKPQQPLSLKHSEEAKDTVYTRYWISNTDQDMPHGYEWVDLDILQLLEDMPDSLQLSLNAGTPDEAHFVFEPESKYALSANYAFELPLELGDDFRLEFADTLQGIPSVVSEVLSHGSLALGGKVTSSLPVQLEVTFNLLDVDGKPVELSGDSGKTLIRACNLDGSPSVSDLVVKLKIKEGVEIPEISAVEMKFKATSGGRVGAFREDSSIQVELNAQLPDGITVDLKELDSLMGEEETDDVQ